uniref:Uncharacterized protein n=1 Tax=Rhizophora mucronata TaxID=61149 RepID=A0A2P2N2L2_RHIMU
MADDTAGSKTSSSHPQLFPSKMNLKSCCDVQFSHLNLEFLYINIIGCNYCCLSLPYILLLEIMELMSFRLLRKVFGYH